MKIGFNITSPESYRIAKELISIGSIDFVEILVDNFTHLDPDHILKNLHGVDIGFHIMKSEYIERDSKSLSAYAQIIKQFSKILKPLYISDHLATFNIHTMALPITAEIEYDQEYDKVASRVNQWQEMLGTKVLLENFPSRIPGSIVTQAEFMKNLLKDTNCGLLFDLSNAVVADLNGAAPVSSWLNLKNHCQHFHVAGYKTMGHKSTEKWIIDSHDSEISENTIAFSKSFISDLDGKSIIIERDANLDLKSIEIDIQNIRSLVKTS